ncbi:MAG: glutamine--scyllo-inositol aminotransferase [Bacteroidetes bacterium]|nr:MAG: glutamine--scyllo-inositol aminotransferase [Bacteroidota bacterium]
MTSNRFIPLAKPNILESDIENVAKVLRSGMLVQGTEVLNLEKELADFLNVKHVICLSNGTATLHTALMVLDIKEGDEVIIPALSYVATANVIERVGATPIFVDVDERSFNIDVTEIEAAITSRTKAIMPVHEFGLVADIGEIKRISDKHNLFLIEDAACALGSSENGKMAGTTGEFGSFSFHPRKAITSGEGGCLCTNDDKLAEKARILRNHGIDMSSGEMTFVEAGLNYRMTDFQAALLKGQLERVKDTLSYKSDLSDCYNRSLTNPNITVPIVKGTKTHAWQTYHVLIESPLERDQMISKLKEKGIGTNYGAQCMPAQEFYFKKYKLDSKSLFPNAYKAYTQGLALPLYELLTIQDIEYISQQVNQQK